MDGTTCIIGSIAFDVAVLLLHLPYFHFTDDCLAFFLSSFLLELVAFFDLL